MYFHAKIIQHLWLHPNINLDHHPVHWDGTQRLFEPPAKHILVFPYHSKIVGSLIIFSSDNTTHHLQISNLKDKKTMCSST